MRTQRTYRAMSLVETLVVSALFLLLGSLVLTFFFSLTRASLRGMAKASAEQQSVIIFQRWLRDLQSTSTSALSWEPDLGAAHLKALAIQPIEDVSNQGMPVYSDQRLICYYWDPALKQLKRREWLTAPGAVALDRDIPKRLTPAQLTSLSADPAATESRYDLVNDFDLGNPAPYPFLGSPLAPTLLVVLPQGQGQGTVDQYRLTRTVVLRSTPE